MAKFQHPFLFQRFTMRAMAEKKFCFAKKLQPDAELQNIRKTNWPIVYYDE